MTKAIKFNLTLDKKPVRDLDDLLENFNLDDLLNAYHSQSLLQRWLEVRGLNSELNQLMSISSQDEQEIAVELCKIFQSNLTENEIKSAVYPFLFRREKEQHLKQLSEQKFRKDAVINSYHSGYMQLHAMMLEKADDYPFLKAAIDTLWKDYEQLFRVDFDSFFTIFKVQSRLTLFAMMANDVYRESEFFDENRKNEMFSLLPVPITNQGLLCPLNPPYQFYAGVTEGYWKDLVPKGRKCLILKMEPGNFVRNAAESGEELKSEDINSKFIVLDGVDYKSNNANHALIYMVI